MQKHIAYGKAPATVNTLWNTVLATEVLAMATYCQHTEQVSKIMEVREKMIHDIVISDSLYLHL